MGQLARWARGWTFLWPWGEEGSRGESRGRERRGGGRTRLCLPQLLSRPKQSWVQVLNCPRQVSHVPSHSLRRACMDRGRRGKDGNTLSLHVQVMVQTRATWGQGSQQQPGPGLALRFLHAGEKLNGGQSAAGWGGPLTLDVNRHTHLIRPDSLTSAHCWSVSKHVPRGVKLQQRRDLGHTLPTGDTLRVG